MKKVLCLCSVIGLAACTNPDIQRPWMGGPTYYKVPECVTEQIYPNSFRQFNQQTGMYDKYITLGGTTQTRCNYNPLMQQPATLNSVYLYGTRN